MIRGEIWWASPRAPSGSDPAYRRPVLIVQADSFNRSKINTVITVAITSNLRLAQAPGNVRLAKRQTGLERDSVVNISQVVTLNKSFLIERVSRIPITKLQDVDEGLRLVLGL